MVTNYDNRYYTDEVGRISWSDIGVEWDNPGGDYVADDPTSGIKILFSIKDDATKQQVIQAMNGAIFEVGYTASGANFINATNIVNDDSIADTVKLQSLKVRHSSTHGDFFRELGYSLDRRSDIMGGIDVEIYLVKNDYEKPALEFKASNGNTLTTNVVSDRVGGNKLDYYYSTTSSAIYAVEATSSLTSTFSDRIADLTNFIDNNGGRVKLADAHIPDYFEYRMGEFKTTSVTERKVSNVKTVPYNVDDLPDSSDQNNTINDLSSVVPDRLSSLVRGSSLSLWIQSGPDATDGMNINIDNMTVDTLGLSDVNVSTEILATESIDKIANALEKLSSIRSSIGAQQNRLEHTYDNVKNTSENTQASESRIRDTDIAKEMVAYSKHNILEQIGTAMVTQANQSTQGVLNLIQ